ncbi:MAG TPA: IniB N-terminal domain-containing protein, partial [Phycicoccus sp.]|nr:IniB N-terminal domain-containing protein [Phycicoccus sp.]
MSMVSDLLDFILNLLRNPDAAAAFNADPEGSLAKAGLGGLTCADVDAVRPVVLDVAMAAPSGGGGHGGGGHGGGGNHGGGHGGGGNHGGGH